MLELLLMAQLSLCNPQVTYRAEDYEWEYYQLLKEHEELQEDYDELEDKYGDREEYQPPYYED